MRNKKTIAIVIITLILAIVATVGIVMYLNDDGTAKAGFEGNVTHTISPNGDNAPTNDENMGNNGETNNEGINNGETSEGVKPSELPQAGTTGNTGTTRPSGTTNSTSGTSDLPDEEYTVERIEEVERQITEDLLVGWTPISINSKYSTAGLGIYKPELSTTKVVATEYGKDYVVPGEILTYGIAVKNIGNDELKGVNISDIVPAQTTLISETTYIYQNEEYKYDVGNYNEELNKISWKADLAVDETIVVGFAVLLNEEANGTIKNVAVVNGDETNEVENPVVVIEKSVAQTEPLREGDVIDYTITIENTGDIDATINTVTDVIPNGTTYVEASANNEAVFENNTLTWNEIALEKQSKVELTFQVTINELPEGVYELNIPNVAVVDEKETNKVENNVIKPHITRSKINTPEGNVHEGDEITYTITVGNDGTDFKEIVIEDAVPSGTTLVEGSIATPEGAIFETTENNGLKWIVILEPGDNKDFVFKVTVNELLEGVYGLNIPNTAIVDEEETNKVENDVVKPNITRSKVNTPDGNVHEGDAITYTITAENTGTEAKEIVVEDAVPEGTTLAANSVITPEGASFEATENNGLKWTVTLQPGDNKEFKFSVTVNELPEGVYGLNIPNTAIVDEEETNKVENDVIKPNITRSKANTPDGNVHEGDTITYTITAGNDGTEAKEIVIEDAVPVGTTLVEGSIVTPEGATFETTENNGLKWTVTLQPEDSKEFEFSVTVNELPEGVYELNIPNTAVVDEEETNKVENDVVKPNITRNKAKVTNTTSTIEGTVHEGDEITYTITAGNTGTAAKNIDVIDEVPSGTTLKEIITPGSEKLNTAGTKFKWNITLQPEETKEFKFVVTVNTLPSGTYTLGIPNTAIVDNINTNEVKDTVIKPNITRSKANSPLVTTKLHEGDTITYTITAGNNGTEAKNIDVIDEVPSGTTLKEIITPGSEKLNAAGTKFKWNVTLKPGDNKEFKFSVTINTLPNGTYTLEIPNTAIVDNVNTNEVKNVVIKPHLTNLSKTSSPASGSKVEYGNVITYTISVTNDGTEATNAVITDAIPTDSTFQEVLDGGTRKTIDGVDSVTWTKTVEAGKTVSVRFKVKAAGHGGDVINNIAYVTYNGNAPEATNKTTHTIIDEITTTSTSKNGKNIIIVLDLSSSMLQAKKSDIIANNVPYPDKEGEAGYQNASNSDYIYPDNRSTCVEYSVSKLAYAKKAIKSFATKVMKDNPDNRLTLITFNYSSVSELKAGIKDIEDYVNDYDKYDDIIKKYVGTKTLISKEDSAADFNAAVDAIKIRSRYLLTNMRRAIEYTNTVVQNMKSDGKEIDVIFFGDGKPSYTGEGCVVAYNADNGYGFYNETNTNKKIEAAGKAIRNTAGTKLFTVEYLVPTNEKTQANTAFTKMTGKSTQDNKTTRFSATADDVSSKLADISNKLDIPVDDTEAVVTTGTNKGKAVIEIPLGNTLRISSNELLIVTVDGKEEKYKSKTDINNSGGKVKYTEGNATTTSKITIDTTKYAAGSEINVSYFYKNR